ncbi:MAG: STELLO glycosyltransferase family protein [Spirulinaceae cyanobacterium]
MKTVSNLHPTLVVTSISEPNLVLQALAKGCQTQDMSFILVGDTRSPDDFKLDGCQFFSIAQQLESGLEFARLCPTQKYSRKNIGYLLAAQQGATVIVETDDDNFPYESFWPVYDRHQSLPQSTQAGWLNVYRYFTDALIWPRGLPLNQVNSDLPEFKKLPSATVDCPIQQGLADDNPDVDAIYRLLLPLPLKFRSDRNLALSAGSWCPFNSQNTTWWQDAFLLMYLPTYCSFRMTDIWRSFIAQKIAWANDWSVLFHQPTVWQERNEHNLMQDFRQEVDGYLRNHELRIALERVELRPGVAEIPDNLRRCYQHLIELEFFAAEETTLLEAWLTDWQGLCQ